MKHKKYYPLMLSCVTILFTTLALARQGIDVADMDEVDIEYFQSHILSSLEDNEFESIGMQGFEGDYALSDDPDEVVEIIVQFHTPPLLELELIYEGELDQPTDLELDDDLEDQAQTAHDEFDDQFGALELPPDLSEPIEIFCETYYVFNGVHMRVPTSMIEDIANLPEVFSVTPHILPEIPLLDEPEELPTPVAPQNTRPSPHLVNDALMRNTRTRLNLDAVHLDMNITGRGVVVASIDTGIDHNHPEFRRFHDRTGRVPGWQFHHDNRPTNHGTQTAGSIIAMAPEVELWSLQRSAAGVNGGTAIGALNFAVQTARADVIYMWGWHPNSPFSAEASAVSLAVEAGHIVVAAVHNQARPWSSSHQIPQNLWREGNFEAVTHNGIAWQSVLNPLSPLAIHVGAGTFGSDSNPTNTDNITNFSGRGPVPRTLQIKPDIIANGQWGWTTFDRSSGSSYGWFSGTSQAGPLATGIVALLVQQFTDDTPYKIKARLMNTGRQLTGTDMGNANQYLSVFTTGAGFVNPYDALRSNTFVTVDHDVPLSANQNTRWESRAMSSFSFGSLTRMSPNNSQTLRATIHNQSNETITYIIDHEFSNNPNQSALITLSQRAITVEPNQTEHFYVGISVVGNVQGGVTAFFEGNILVSGGNRDLRLPFALVNPRTSNLAGSKLNFDLQGGSISLNTNRLTEIDPINVLHGANLLTFLSQNHNGFTEPTRAGYTFEGWYLDSNYQTTLSTATTMPTRNTTLFARWLENLTTQSTAQTTTSTTDPTENTTKNSTEPTRPAVTTTHTTQPTITESTEANTGLTEATQPTTQIETVNTTQTTTHSTTHLGHPTTRPTGSTNTTASTTISVQPTTRPRCRCRKRPNITTSTSACSTHTTRPCRTRPRCTCVCKGVTKKR